VASERDLASGPYSAVMRRVSNHRFAGRSEPEQGSRRFRVVKRAPNAVFAAAGYNFRRLLAWLRFLLFTILLTLGLLAQPKLA
jgi:hypothetical protein